MKNNDHSKEIQTANKFGHQSFSHGKPNPYSELRISRLFGQAFHNERVCSKSEKSNSILEK